MAEEGVLSQELVPQMPQEVTPVAVEPAFVPALVAGAGPRAAMRFVEFFTAHIRNANTRRAYHRAVLGFCAWCDQQGLQDVGRILPIHVAAYVEELQQAHSKPTVKQHLAAIRMLFDWLVTGQIVPANPATSVRGPTYAIKHGKTPVLSAEEARLLLSSMDTSHVVGLRDRALIGMMTYTFARVGAVLAMRVQDYYPAGKRWWVRLHEKGGKHHEMPAHHKLEQFLDEYVRAAGIGEEKKGWLFRTALGKTKTGISAYPPEKVH